MDYSSFAGQTFGAEDVNAIQNLSFSSGCKHPRISKLSPFYRMGKPQTEQKPRLQLFSPSNKENETRYGRKPHSISRVLPHDILMPAQNSNTKQSQIHSLIAMFKKQQTLYERLLIKPEDEVTKHQILQLQLRFEQCVKKL